MDKDNYMKETYAQLNDGRFYKKIENDNTTTFTKKLKLLISELQPNLLNDTLKLIPFPSSSRNILRHPESPYAS